MRLIITSFLAIFILVKSEAQELVFKAPAKLDSEVNSGSEESSVFLCEVSKRLYFSRSEHAKNTGGVSGGQDVWYCSKEEEKWTEASNDLKNINNKGNNAIIGISESGDTIYLLNKYKGKTTSIGISYTIKEENGWSIPKPINIPGLKYNEGYYGFNMHPNGRILIASINLKNSIGMEDLYMSLNDGNGSWSNLIHLGDIINSEGFEITPYITKNGRRLYFSSNGHKGMGNADVFVSNRIDDSWTNWSEPVNLGEKINSIGFDASFSIWRDSLVYFCSNRSGIMNDIFRSKLLKLEEPVEEFQEIVNLANNTLAELGDLLETSFATIEEEKVEVVEEKEVVILEDTALLYQIQEMPDFNNIIEATEMMAEMKGNKLIEDTIIEIEAPVNDGVDTSYEKEIIEEIITETSSNENQAPLEDIINDSEELREPSPTEIIHYDKKNDSSAYALENLEETEEIGIAVEELAQTKNRNETDDPMDLGSNYRDSLNQLYFNHNSSYLNFEARNMLDNLLVKLLEQNNLNLEVWAFADNLGEAHYNMWISERRAKRVIEYFVSKGIDPSRLNGKWFGENKPAEECSECTEMQHQENRRVELVVE